MVKNIVTVYHNLSTLLDAGLSMVRSLNIAAKGLRGPLPKVFADIEKTVANGNTLAEGMIKHPRIFAPMDIRIVQAGETSGSLVQSLQMLSQWYELQRKLMRMIYSGMLFPAMILLIAAFVGPIPGFVFGGFDTKSYFMSVLTTLACFYVPILTIAAIVKFTPKTGIPRRILDFLSLLIPVLRPAIKHIAISRYSRVFYMLYKAGVPIAQASKEAVDMTGNSIISDMLRGGAESAKNGNPVSEGFSKNLPADFLNLWQMAEESGKLDDTAIRLARSHGETAEMYFEEFSRWLPKIVYVAVSVYIIIKIFQNASMVFNQATSIQ